MIEETGVILVLLIACIIAFFVMTEGEDQE
jgi:succinate dehydrogenase hydrophobic anchor subunit